MGVLFTILLHWILFALAAAGFGLIIERLRGRDDSIWDTVWTGVAATLGGLQVWHLFWPVASGAVLVFGLVALVGLVLGFVQRDRRDFRSSLTVLLLVFVIASWLAWQVQAPGLIYDSEVYHLATIRWNTVHPVVPGLANLYIYFGLNQSYFLLGALLDQASWLPAGWPLLNGFLLALILAEAWVARRQTWRHKQTVAARRPAWLLVLLLPLLLKSGALHLSSPSPDLLVNVLIVRIFYRTVAMLATPPNEREGIQFSLLVMGFAALTVKLSLIAFAGTVILIVVADRTYSAGGPQERLKRCALPAALTLVFLAPYVARGIIASGYPLFPFTGVVASVDWVVPKAEVDEFAHYIRGYARTHAHGDAALAAAYGESPWVGEWLIRTVRSVPVGLLLVSGVAFAIVAATRRQIWGSRSEFWLPLGLLVIATAFWLWSAPDIRFGGWILLCWAAWMGAIVLEGSPFLAPRAIVGAVVLVGLVVGGHYRPVTASYPKAPRYPMEAVSLAEHVEVWRPVQAAGEPDWRIGYAAPLATAQLPDDLVLRDDSVRSGFKRRSSP